MNRSSRFVLALSLITLLIYAASAATTLPRPVANTAFVVESEDLLLFGGQVRVNGTKAFSSEVVRYSGADGSTVVIGTLPTPVMGAGAVRFAGGYAIVGGSNSRGPVADVLFFMNGTTEIVAKLPKPLSNPIVTADDHRIVVIGGITACDVGCEHPRLSREVMVIEPPDFTPRFLQELPFGIVGPTITRNETVFVFGGMIDEGYGGFHSRRIVAVEMNSGRAISRESFLPKPITGSAVVADGNRVIIIGGDTPEGLEASIVAYDFVSGLVLESNMSIPGERAAAAAILTHETISVIGGVGCGGPCGTVLQIDTRALHDSFHVVPSQSRSAPTLALGVGLTIAILGIAIIWRRTSSWRSTLPRGTHLEEEER